jgi:hypothetical protein
MTTSKHSMALFTCELLAVRNVDKKDLAKERDLMASCWWEYRGIHPVNRTILFAEVYEAMTKRFHEKYVDYSTAAYVSGLRFTANKIFPDGLEKDEKASKTKKANLTGLWRARAAADELCIAYPIYLAALFEHAAMNGWLHKPRPAQLYSDKMKTIALDAQAMEIERYIPDFKNPLLQVGSTAPFKSEFDEWLFELGKLRSIHKDLVYNRMADLGYITPEKAEEWIALATQ